MKERKNFFLVPGIEEEFILLTAVAGYPFFSGKIPSRFIYYFHVIQAYILSVIILPN